MSVINKMLRDLDQRHAGPSAGGKPQMAPGEHLTQGTLPLPPLKQRSHGASRKRWMWAGALLLAVAALGWYLQSGYRTQVPLSQPVAIYAGPPVVTPKLAAPAPAPAPAAVPVSAAAPAVAASESAPLSVPVVAVAVAQASVPVLVASAPEMKPEAVGAQPAPMVKKAMTPLAQPAPTVLPTPKALAKTVEPKPVVPRQTQATVAPPQALASPGGDTDSLRMESSLMRLPKSAKATPLVDAGRSAALEALAQAQSLWTSGSHAAAIELLQQALARVEGSTSVTGQAALASLTRELARMQLADGQVSQALALLTRLEPQLSQIADVWAMRGNAAQRLGRHAEAAQSYKQALALKPDEPRWMLGAAVSLAAQGQTAAAGELAEKARAMGALRPDVANYLRQLGVPTRAD